MKKRNIIWDILYPSVFMLLAVFAVTIIVSVIAALITGENSMDSSTMRQVPLIASAAFYVFAVISQRKQFLLDEMRFGADRKAVNPAVPAAAVPAAMALADLFECLIAKLGLYELFPQYESVAVQTFQSQNIVLLLLTTAVLAPVAEEMMFRGMTYRRARHWIGQKKAVILSAFLFGLYHMNGVQFVYAMLLGIFLAWLYEHSETLIVPIVCHGAANVWEIVLEYGIDQPQRLVGNQRAVLLAAEAVLAVFLIGYLFRLFHKTTSQK